MYTEFYRDVFITPNIRKNIDLNCLIKYETVKTCRINDYKDEQNIVNFIWDCGGCFKNNLQ